MCVVITISLVAYSHRPKHQLFRPKTQWRGHHPWYIFGKFLIQTKSFKFHKICYSCSPITHNCNKATHREHTFSGIVVNLPFTAHVTFSYHPHTHIPTEFIFFVQSPRKFCRLLVYDELSIPIPYRSNRKQARYFV